MSVDLVRQALYFAADVIELFDDATMQADYMLDAGECAGIIRALVESPRIKGLSTDTWRGSVPQTICDLPIPDEKEARRQGFVDCKMAILDALRTPTTARSKT